MLNFCARLSGIACGEIAHTGCRCCAGPRGPRTPRSAGAPEGDEREAGAHFPCAQHRVAVGLLQPNSLSPTVYYKSLDPPGLTPSMHAEVLCAAAAHFEVLPSPLASSLALFTLAQSHCVSAGLHRRAFSRARPMPRGPRTHGWRRSAQPRQAHRGTILTPWIAVHVPSAAVCKSQIAALLRDTPAIYCRLPLTAVKITTRCCARAVSLHAYNILCLPAHIVLLCYESAKAHATSVPRSAAAWPGRSQHSSGANSNCDLARRKASSWTCAPHSRPALLSWPARVPARPQQQCAHTLPPCTLSTKHQSPVYFTAITFRALPDL